jgi:parvulin-like peptidyl-prolyl isomerase
LGSSTLCFAALCLAAGRAEAKRPTPDEPVARVDDRTITRAEIETLLGAQIPAVRRKYRKPEARRDFVEHQVDLDLLAAEARRRGLEADPEVRRVVAQALAHRLLEQEEAAVPPPGDESLRAFFAQHSAEYMKPATRRVAHLLIQPRRRGGRAKAQEAAQRLYQEAAAHRDDHAYFQRLVETYSDDEETRLRGGDLRYFTADDPAVQKTVRETAFAVEALGDVALCESPLGFHVLMLIGRRGASRPSFEDVRDKIEKRVRREQRGRAGDALLDELRRHAAVQIEDQAIRRVRVQRP